MQNQVLDTRYIERSLLLKLLRQLFGDDFLVEDRPDRYALTVPRKLTEVLPASPWHGLGFLARGDRLDLSPNMEALRRRVEHLRYQNENAYGRHFVPHDKLLHLMTKENVKKALEDSAMKRYNIDETTETIIRRAYKIFGILILIGQPESILIFIKDDGHRQSCIDDKLPFSLDVLQEMFSDDILTRQFNEKQKEFTIPIFDRSTLPRDFKGETALPFVEDHHIGSGGFGNVHKIRITPSHQLYDLSTEWFVRKEFRPESTKDDFEKELHNLSMLRVLRHPNILELLGVYTYKGMHNFLFPLASEGNLAQLLQNGRSPYFQTNEDFLVALAGLGSAVCAMHEYSSEHLQAIGCHHDLKPSNILVDKSKFILADFGLSRLKEPPQTSATLPKDARGDYLAPECEDLEADCEKHVVHRSSDIWSFGCIIAELLTYMSEGPSSVKEFEVERVFSVRGLVLWRFHCGPGKPSKAVMDWMERIKSKCHGPEKQLALLTEDMLSIKPEDRPRASAVEKRLCAISIQAIIQPVNCLYTDVSKKSGSLQVFVEQKKFASWEWAYGLAKIENFSTPIDPYEWRTYESFQSVLTNLRDLQNILRIIESDNRISKSLLPLQLRKFNDQLFEMLPQKLQDEAMNMWEQSLLETTDDRLLGQVSGNLSEENSKSSLSALAAIKQMGILVKKRSSQNVDLFLKSSSFQDQKNLENFTTQFGLQDGENTVPVLVERKRVDLPEKEDCNREAILDRLEDIAELINCADRHNGLRVLHCRGMYHDEVSSAFGMVYDFPDLSVPKTELQCTTLAKTLERRPDNQELPLLGDRFRLGHDLAISLFRFHSVGWLHKSISSKVVMFFYPQDSHWNAQMNSWYLRGFLHSRLNESIITEGLTSDPESMDYQHPDYLQSLKLGSWRYLPKFDYYSLGIVLLEIGLWRSLKDITRNWKGTPGQMREKLLHSAVPALGPRAGAPYRDAVISCLTWGITDTQRADSTASHLSFKGLVVDKLAQCRA